MKIYYFPSPVDATKVASVITEDTPEQLIAKGVFDRNTKYVMQPYTPLGNNPDMEALARASHIEYMKFDNASRPTRITLDHSAIQDSYLVMLRTKRADIFEKLDIYTSRAISMNKLDVAAMIEQDKQTLRNLPETLDFSGHSNITDYMLYVPEALKVDYAAKYDALLK